MIAYLIGKRSGSVIEVWQGSDDELRDRFEYEDSGDYLLDIYDGGVSVCELSH